MSTALNSRPEISLNNSSGTIPELSLSIGSGISTPAKHNLHVPSGSSGTRSSTDGSKGSHLTLRDQEKVCHMLSFHCYGVITLSHSTSTTSRKRTSTSNSASTFSKNDWRSWRRTK